MGATLRLSQCESPSSDGDGDDEDEDDYDDNDDNINTMMKCLYCMSQKNHHFLKAFCLFVTFYFHFLEC